MNIPRLTIQEICEYEIIRAGWPSFVSVGWMQNLIARYFVWKATRIHRRIERFRWLCFYGHLVTLARQGKALSKQAEPPTPPASTP